MLFQAFFGIVIIIPIIITEAGLIEKFNDGGRFCIIEALSMNFIRVIIFLFKRATILIVYFLEHIDR